MARGAHAAKESKKGASLIVILAALLTVIAQCGFCQNSDTNPSRLVDGLNQADNDRNVQELRRLLQANSERQAIQRGRKRACAVGVGMSHHCSLSLIDEKLKFREQLLNGMGPGKRSIKRVNNNNRKNNEISNNVERRNNTNVIPDNRAESYLYYDNNRKSDDNIKYFDNKDSLGNSLDNTDNIMNIGEDVGDMLSEKDQQKEREILLTLLGNRMIDIGDKTETQRLQKKRTCSLNLGGHCSTESAARAVDQWHYLNSPLSPGRRRRALRAPQPFKVAGQNL